MREKVWVLVPSLLLSHSVTFGQSLNLIQSVNLKSLISARVTDSETYRDWAGKVNE